MDAMVVGSAEIGRRSGAAASASATTTISSRAKRQRLTTPLPPATIPAAVALNEHLALIMIANAAWLGKFFVHTMLMESNVARKLLIFQI